MTYNLDQTSIDMQQVDDCLDIAKEQGLEVEVVFWALRYMKQDPSLTIAAAINLGLQEWVK